MTAEQRDDQNKQARITVGIFTGPKRRGGLLLQSATVYIPRQPQHGINHSVGPTMCSIPNLGATVAAMHEVLDYCTRHRDARWMTKLEAIDGILSRLRAAA